MKKCVIRMHLKTLKGVRTCWAVCLHSTYIGQQTDHAPIRSSGQRSSVHNVSDIHGFRYVLYILNMYKVSYDVNLYIGRM